MKLLPYNGLMREASALRKTRNQFMVIEAGDEGLTAAEQFYSLAA